ncbi:HNH endonuclease signature motif containing protein [Microbacterium terregens]
MGHAVGSDGPGVWKDLDDLVTRVVENRAAIAALQADEASLLADAVDLMIARTEERRVEGRLRTDNDLPLREICAELGSAMRMSDRTVQARIGDASTLLTSFRATHDAWRAGLIDAGHVAAIRDAGAGIGDAAERVRYERQLLDAAAHESPARLRALARVVAARIDPTSIDERHRVARANRDVRVIGLEDGMARLLADVPSTLAYAICDRLTQMAHTVRDAGLPTPDISADDVCTANAPASPHPPDSRSIGELRADILADILLTATPTAHGDRDALGAIGGRVQVTVPVLTAAGLSDEPALLAGQGPIDSATARRLAADAPGWDRVMIHPHTGVPLAVDRYRPSAELRRFLAVRDEHCRFPGCRMPVWRCDVDHTTDAARGGVTGHQNLANLCRRHHTLKHASEWKVTQIGGGVLEWTSPTRRRYTDRPPSSVSFVPESAFAPPDGVPPPF